MRVETTRAPRAPRSRWRVGVAIVVCTVLVATISLASARAVTLLPDADRISASVLHAQPGSLPWNGHDPFTILLLGTDRSDSGRARTPAMLILSFRPQERGIRLLSIPGNLWVTIPGFGPGRIEDANADGGPTLASFVVQSVTRIPIPYYAVVGRDSAEELIDALGGVNFPAPSSRIAGVALARRQPALHLTGRAALAYLDGSGPGARDGRDPLERQQHLLISLKEQTIRPESLFRIPSILNTLGGSIETNVPYNQVPSLARAMMTIPPSRIGTAQIGATSGTAQPYTTSGMRVLVPDWLRIVALARRSVGPTSADLPHVVQVLNGSPVAGRAESLAGWLRQSGIGVQGYATADSLSYAHTQVSVAAGAAPAVTGVARDIATLLQAPLVTGSVLKGGAPVVVTIGQDYQSPIQQ